MFKPMVLITTLLCTGCAGNAINFMEYRGKVKLIDATGTVYTGTSQFHIGRRDGQFTLPATSYGNLQGELITRANAITSSGSSMTMISGSKPVLIPSLASQTITSPDKNGTAYLYAGNKMVLQCDINVRFQIVGYPVAYMLGNGICTDGHHDNIQILFMKP